MEENVNDETSFYIYIKGYPEKLKLNEALKKGLSLA